MRMLHFGERLTENAWKKMAKAKKGGASLLTAVSLIEGEILNYLDEHGFARLKKIVRDLDWPMAEVMMGVGALIRDGLVEVRRDRFGLMLHPVAFA